MSGRRVAAVICPCASVLTGTAAAQKTIDLGSPAGRLILDGAVAGARAGAWVYHGDLTGDYWRKELIVGSPDEASRRGAVRVFIGAPRPVADLSTAFADVVLTGEAAEDRFGTAGDAGFVMREELLVNRFGPVGDPYARALVVSAPGAAGGNGAVYVFAGPLGSGTLPAASAAVRIAAQTAKPAELSTRNAFKRLTLPDPRVSARRSKASA